MITPTTATITDQHLEFWHAIVKRDDGPKRFHIPSALFYFVDLTVFVINVATHASNGAWLGLGLTIGIHFVSAWIISSFYKKNENSIDEDNVVFRPDTDDGAEVWKWKLLRRICQCLAITPLFRIISNWRDHRENHNFVREQRIHRRPINSEEVKAIVLNKKRACVKSYFDSLHAYFKTVPQCVLQIYLAVDVNLPLRFCTLTDVTRMTVLVWTVIAASKATAGHSFALTEYLKSLHFQDYVNLNSPMDLNPPKRHTYWVTLIWNFIFVGSRIYGLSYLISYGAHWVLTLIILVFICNMMWMRNCTYARLSYENPPSGVVTMCSDLVDRYINVFCLHMINPTLKNVVIHQLLYVTCYILTVGIAIFQVYGLEWITVVESVNHAFNELHSKCNLTIFSDSLNGFARVLHEILNSNYIDGKPSNFKDVFSNEVVLMWSMILSSLASILYCSVYCKRWGIEHNSDYPLQNSLREWKVFLDRNWAEVGQFAALKTLLLGIVDTDMLEFWKYKLPEGQAELRALLVNYTQLRAGIPDSDLVQNGDLDFSGEPVWLDIQTENEQDFSNIVHQDSMVENDESTAELLGKFGQYLRGLSLGIETEPATDYFVNHFRDCMKQMTSYRIAQTHSLLEVKTKRLDRFRNFCNCFSRFHFITLFVGDQK